MNNKVWGPTDPRRINQALRFDSTFIEYKEWVTANNRFPTDTYDGKTKRGTSLTGWRRNIASGKGPEGAKEKLEAYDEAIQKTFPVISKPTKFDELFTDLTYSIRKEGDPETLKEYLEGDLRFQTFTPYIYMRMMEAMKADHENLWVVQLATDIVGERDNRNYTWNKFHETFPLKEFPLLFQEVILSLTEREQFVLKHNYGVGIGFSTSMCEVGKLLGDFLGNEHPLSTERIRQIKAKALRKLRHPSRARRLYKRYFNYLSLQEKGENKEVPIERAIGHWFQLMIESEKGFSESHIIKLPMEQLEEAIEAFGCNLIEPFPDHRVRSVKTIAVYFAEANDQMQKEIGDGIKPEQIIAYTKVELQRAAPYVPFDPVKFLREQAAAEEKRLADEEKKRLREAEREEEINRAAERAIKEREERLKEERLRLERHDAWIGDWHERLFYGIRPVLYPFKKSQDLQGMIDATNCFLSSLPFPKEFSDNATRLIKKELTGAIPIACNLRLLSVSTDDDEMWEFQIALK